jgi:hypothetical protein
MLLHQAARQRALQLETKRKEHIRAVLIGQNFIEGDHRAMLQQGLASLARGTAAWTLCMQPHTAAVV